MQREEVVTLGAGRKTKLKVVSRVLKDNSTFVASGEMYKQGTSMNAAGRELLNPLSCI